MLRRAEVTCVLEGTSLECSQPLAWLRTLRQKSSVNRPVFMKHPHVSQVFPLASSVLVNVRFHFILRRVQRNHVPINAPFYSTLKRLHVEASVKTAARSLLWRSTVLAQTAAEFYRQRMPSVLTDGVFSCAVMPTENHTLVIASI